MAESLTGNHSAAINVDRLNRMIVFKRLFDVILATAGLMILSPLVICIAAIIKREDGGPVFYRGVRVGIHGTLFRIFKFRTMAVNAESMGGPTASARDPRVTSVGRWLRKYKLDELPQLLNVILGEMSLVGPRPEVKSEVDCYDPQWNVIFSVRPGITDLSSIEFVNEGEVVERSGIENPHEAYKKIIQPRKLELQRYYAVNCSMALDLRILFDTLCALIRTE
jgi:lipopolysaccharide/colanic/teichoic acid biosynthesis glycosyltransferase